MTQNPERGADFTMRSYWRSGERLVTRELAVAIATHLTINKFGAASLDEQLPFSVSETPTEWIILGNKIISEKPVPGRGPVLGKVEIALSKRDCQVLSFVIHGEFAVRKG